jgi:cyclophilin family peptidyl-prolyl cis-trans isomerase
LTQDEIVGSSIQFNYIYERHESAGLRNDIYRMQVHQVQHLGFSDFTLFVRNPVRARLFGAIDSTAMIQIQNDFVLGFLDRHLLQQQNDFPQAAYAKHALWVEKNDISDVRAWWLASHPEDVTERVLLETSQGEIEIALYPKRAPIAVKHFLAAIDAGSFAGASFQRTSSQQTTRRVELVRAGLLANTRADHSFKIPALKEAPGPDQTRSAAGGAGAEFFINIQDNSLLNSATTTAQPGSPGYGPFGRVLRGMRIVEQIQPQSSEVKPLMTGPISLSPLVIEKARRVNTALVKILE